MCECELVFLVLLYAPPLLVVIPGGNGLVTGRYVTVRLFGSRGDDCVFVLLLLFLAAFFALLTAFFAFFLADFFVLRLAVVPF